MTPSLAAPWLLGASREGIVAVGPRTVVAIELERGWAERVALVDGLASGVRSTSIGSEVGMAADEVDALRAELVDAAVLAPSDASGQRALPELDGAQPLADVLRSTFAGGVPVSCYTAEELLLVPPGCAPALARRALHAFVGGLRPEARATVYGLVAAHGVGARGDRPAADVCERRSGLEPALLHVVSLRGESTVSISPDDFERLGAEHPHRLGVIQELTDGASVELEDRRLAVARARYLAPNLRLHQGGWSYGADPDPARAELVARAEAAERHAIGRTSGVELRRAGPDIEGALAPELFSSPNLRQARALPLAPSTDRLWVGARTQDGARRWIAAELVLAPFTDPQRPEPWLSASSSGAAAHRTVEEATEAALLELVERDALMWRWVQRVPPARVAPAALPDATRSRIDALHRAGWDVRMANLTLDLLPVVLCAMCRPGQLALGMGCARSAIRAADRALEECLMIAWAGRERPPDRISDPAEVKTPSDHLALHHDPEHARSHEFLFEADDEVDLRELPTRREPLSELVRPIGEPLVVVFHVPSVLPFRVVRALVPGLVPISFGFDREPLGLRRLAHPIAPVARDTIGSRLDLSTAGPILPHPFP